MVETGSHVLKVAFNLLSSWKWVWSSFLYFLNAEIIEVTSFPQCFFRSSFKKTAQSILSDNWFPLCFYKMFSSHRKSLLQNKTIEMIFIPPTWKSLREILLVFNLTLITYKLTGEDYIYKTPTWVTSCGSDNKCKV